MATGNTSHVMCGMSELEYSPAKLVQNEIDHAYTTELTPHNSIVPGNNIIFHIEGGTDFVDLANTHLVVDIRLSKSDGTGLTDANKVCPINNIFHSMWSQIQVKLKDVYISHPSPNYGFRSYLENLLCFSNDSKKTWMKSQGWYFDEAAKFDDEENAALTTRRDMVLSNKIYRVKGRLSTDVGNQALLIPSLTDIAITLTPQRPEFTILNFDRDDSKYQINILSAKLVVRKVKLYPAAVLDFERHIAKSQAKLPISQVKVTTLSIPQGLSSYSHNSLFNGTLPQYIVVGFLKNSAYSGTFTSNPFNFIHNDLNHIQLKVNERLVPTLPITPNYDLDQFGEAYESVYTVIGKLYQDWSSGLSFEDFKGGSALYGFSLNNDTLCRHDSSNLTGQVDIALKFAKPLPETTTMIVYSSTQAVIIIDQHRNVLLES